MPGSSAACDLHEEAAPANYQRMHTWYFGPPVCRYGGKGHSKEKLPQSGYRSSVRTVIKLPVNQEIKMSAVFGGFVLQLTGSPAAIFGMGTRGNLTQTGIGINL